jgi:hypothetical protein
MNDPAQKVRTPLFPLYSEVGQLLMILDGAPITLIDGEKLLDLLIEHEIGMRKRPAQLYEIDEEFFETEAEDDLTA